MKSTRLWLSRLFLVLLFTQNGGIARAGEMSSGDMQDCNHQAMTDSMVMAMDNDSGSCTSCVDEMNDIAHCCLDDCQNACHLATSGSSILPPALDIDLLAPANPQFSTRSMRSSYHGLALIRPPSLG